MGSKEFGMLIMLFLTIFEAGSYAFAYTAQKSSRVSIQEPQYFVLFF
jgi:hypothetical protein